MKQWLKKVSGIEAKEKELAEQKAALEAESDKKLKIKDGGFLYLFFTTDLNNAKVILVCSKV